MLARLRVPSPSSPFEALTRAVRRMVRGINPKTRNRPVAGPDNTRIVPVLDVPISGDANLIWCGAFQLAWNEACDWFKHPIELRPPSLLAETLNLRSFDRKSVDEESIFVASGTVEDGIMEKIKAGVRKMSPAESQLMKGLHPGRGELICFARLKKALNFPKPFRCLGNYPLTGGKVPCFGFLKDNRNADEEREQALIHDYRSPDDFVVELKTKQEGDMLVLARVSPAATLRETMQGVVERLHAAPESAGDRDVLVAPCIQFSDTTSFCELQGRLVVDDSLWYLTRALQSIDFAMDEKGVILVSIGLVQFARCLVPPSIHIMILNPPFLLVMKRKEAKEPYFVFWIANTNPLKRA